jgi:tRNA G18 (ribose-2'-O)-methylase SpoU
MRVARIDGVDDPRLEDYRCLTDAELLRRRGLFVAEGRLVVGRAIEDGLPVVSLLLNEAAFGELETSLSTLPDDTPVYICETGQFSAITGFNLHRGCLAMAKRPAARRSGDVADGSDLLVVLEGVTDPDNIGSVFRNAAAFGAGVLLSPACGDPLYRKAIRTSMGSVLRTPYARLEDWPAGLAMLKLKGFALAALTPAGSAIDLQACNKRQRMALLVGSEGPGLSAAAEAMADVRVRIPIQRNVDSLNLATATGIALYHLRA